MKEQVINYALLESAVAVGALDSVIWYIAAGILNLVWN